jgi:nucleoporin NUP82
VLAVYESVDLGLYSLLSTDPPAISLLKANHPVILPDPIHDDVFFVYHAFGVHSINLSKIVSSLSEALQEDDTGEALLETLKQPALSQVRPILTTFSVETRSGQFMYIYRRLTGFIRKSSNPIIGVAIPNDVYLTYGITILTSATRAISFPLNVRLDPLVHSEPELAKDSYSNLDSSDRRRFFEALPGNKQYISLLGDSPFEVPPVFSNPPGPPVTQTPGARQELRVTPDTLRYLGKVVDQFMRQLRDATTAYTATTVRSELQRQERARQTKALAEVRQRAEALKGPRQRESEARVKALREGQAALLARLDAVLQGFMRLANPDLSDHEKQWLKELKEMEQDVCGTGRGDPHSLRARVSLVRFVPSSECFPPALTSYISFSSSVNMTGCGRTSKR